MVSNFLWIYMTYVRYWTSIRRDLCYMNSSSFILLVISLIVHLDNKDLKGTPSKSAQHWIKFDTSILIIHQAWYKLNLNMLLSLNMTLKTISGKIHSTYKQGHMVIINYCDTTKNKNLWICEYFQKLKCYNKKWSLFFNLYIWSSSLLQDMRSNFFGYKQLITWKIGTK